MSKEEAIDIIKCLAWHTRPNEEDIEQAIKALEKEPKTGHWILVQRDKYIDICCSECGNTRFKEYAYGYTIDELNLERINDLIKKFQMNYCECCGARMFEPQNLKYADNDTMIPAT